MQCENISVCKWKDRRDVFTMSNMHRVVMAPTKNRRGDVRMKPNTMRDYNQYMSGIDHSDQMLSYNTSLRKTLRWYKVGVHIIEIFLYNSHFLYNKSKSQDKQLTYLQFREKVVECFVEPRRRVEGMRPYANFHYLIKIPETEKKKIVTQRCANCYKDGKRRESRFMCRFCPDNPVLCVDPCFRAYHVEAVARDIMRMKKIITFLKLMLHLR